MTNKTIEVEVETPKIRIKFPTIAALSIGLSLMAPFMMKSVPEAPVAEIPAQKGGFISGSCKDLHEMGLGDFRPGDPNYTNQRDGDNDGLACEF